MAFKALCALQSSAKQLLYGRGAAFRVAAVRGTGLLPEAFGRHPQKSLLPSSHVFLGRWMGSSFHIGNKWQGNDHSLIRYYDNHPLPSTPPNSDLDLFSGKALRQRWLSTSSRHKVRKQNGRFLDVKSCQTVGELADMTFNRLNDLSPRNLSSFWTRLPQLLTPKYQKNNSHSHRRHNPDHQQLMEHQFGSIFSKTMADMKIFGPQDLATTALGFAKILQKVDNPRRRHHQSIPEQILLNLLGGGNNSQQKELIFQSIANASISRLGKFEPRYLSNLAYANAIVGVVPVLEDGSTLFSHIAGSSIPLLHKFKPQNISNMVWSFEKVGQSNPKLFEPVANYITQHGNLENFKPQDLSNISLAFAKAGESNPVLFQKISDHIVADRNLREFDSQALSNIVWAYSKVGESNPTLFEKVADHIVAARDLREFNPQNLSNTVWAYAKAGESNPILFQKVADHIVAACDLRNFKSQALSNTVWSFAKAEVPNPTLFQKIAGHIVAACNLSEFKPQHLSLAVWAYATAKESQPHLFYKVADHILALDNLHSFKAEDCSQLLTAFATAGIIHRQLFEKVAAHAVKDIDFKSLDKGTQLNLIRSFEKAEEASKKKDE